MHLVEVDLVELLVEDRDVLGILARQDHIDVGDLLHLGDDVLVVRGRHLRTISPVGLVAVVLLGVVRGGNNHARVTLELADREAQLGGRTQGVEEENREAVRGEDVGHTLGEHARVVAAVVADRHANLLAREVLLQVVGQALRCSAHRVDIHAVGAHAHNAAQAAGTEFEVFVEALHEFLHIVVDQILDLFFRLLVVVSVEPRLRLFQHLLFEFACHNAIGFIYNLMIVCSKNFICKYTE